MRDDATPERLSTTAPRPTPTADTTTCGLATAPAKRSKADPDERFDILVGDRAHRTIGHVLAGAPLPESRAAFAMRVLDATREVIDAHPAATDRKRALLIGTSTYASAYLRRFKPNPPWLFVGSEVTVATGRVDLVFQNEQTAEFIVDEIKAGASRAGQTTAREQVLRYIAGGVEAWGSFFIGVRLLWLASPHSSQFYGPKSRNGRPLNQTPYYSLGDPSR